MKIRYLSDLHLEFLDEQGVSHVIEQIRDHFRSDEEKENEVCVLAGDVGYPSKDNYKVLMRFLNEYFVKTFVIAGNHEHYGSQMTIEDNLEVIRKYFIDEGYPNENYKNDYGKCVDLVDLNLDLL